MELAKEYKRQLKYIIRRGIQLTDFFSLFHLSFARKLATEFFWQQHINITPILNTWQGLAFERVCMAHIRQIRHAEGQWLRSCGHRKNNWFHP